MEYEISVRLSAFFGVLTIMACWQALSLRRLLKFGYRRWPTNLGIVLLDAVIFHEA